MEKYINSGVTRIFKSNIEYKLLPFQFLLLTFWGIWSPQNWSLQIKSVHEMYFALIFFLDSWISIEMLIYFILSFGTDNFKLINLFFVSANITGVYKAIRIIKNRENIRNLIKSYFDYKWVNPRDLDEDKIHKKINSKIRYVTITYSASMIVIVFLKALSPLAEAKIIVPLPVDAWYPYPIGNPYWFWITYFHQVILGSSAVSAHVGIDTLFVGLLLKTSCQINVLKYRLKNLTKIYKGSNMKFESIKNEHKNMIFECIHHHERICRFGDDLNSQFQDMLIILVVSSIPNICINVYALSAYRDHINVQYVATFFCTTSAFLQFFIVCWYANEVSLNSVEVKNAIYEMDWTMFDVSTQKLLIIIMARSLKPIQFSVGSVLPMNLDSFIMIIKGSYTAFNLLQQTSK